MTDQHPLTDDLCHQIADTKDRPFTSIERDNMRAGADWQLEQVIEWLRDIHEEHIGLLAVIKDLREAMRPTTQEDWEDILIAIERKDSVPVPTTLEELSNLSNTTQEDTP